MARRKTRSPSAVASAPATPSTGRVTRSVSRAAQVTVQTTPLVETALQNAPSMPDPDMLGTQVGTQMNFAYGSPDRTAPDTTVRRDSKTTVASILEKSIHAARADHQPLTPVREVGGEENEDLTFPASIPQVELRNELLQPETHVHWETSYEEYEECEESSESESPLEPSPEPPSPEPDEEEEDEISDDGIQRQLEIEESQTVNVAEADDESSPDTVAGDLRANGNLPVRTAEWYQRSEDLFNRAAIINRNHPWAANPNAKPGGNKVPPPSGLRWKRIALGLLALCFILPVLISALTMWYTWLQQLWKPHVPAPVGPGNWSNSHPSEPFHLSGGDYEDRLQNLERVLAALSNQAKEDHSVVQRLAEILPDQIIVSPRSDGGVDIDPAFFSALKAKMQADGLSAGSGTTSPSGDANSVHELSREWASFLKTNDERIAQHIERVFTSTRLGDIQKAIERGIILTKSEFVNILNTKYAEIGDELLQLNEGVNDRVQRLQHVLEKQVHQEVMQRYNSISRDDLLKNIPVQQLEGITQRSYLNNLARTMENINWFSRSLGACVDPRGTSAMYTPPMNWTMPVVGRWLIGRPAPFPQTNQPPDSVLDPWTELDECWCTPVHNTYDHDARITISLKNRFILPKEIGIEFPSADATPFAGTAPQTIEVWGRIPDRTVWKAVQEDIQAGQIYPFRGHFSDDDPEVIYAYEHDAEVTSSVTGGGSWWRTKRTKRKTKETLRKKWTRGGWTPLGRFQYDIRHPTNQPVQMFELDVDLENYHHLGDDVDADGQPNGLGPGTGAAVNAIMIRFVENWGDPERLCVYRVRLHGDEVLLEEEDSQATPSSAAADEGGADGAGTQGSGWTTVVDEEVYERDVVMDTDETIGGTPSSDEVITDGDYGEERKKRRGWFW